MEAIPFKIFFSVNASVCTECLIHIYVRMRDLDNIWMTVIGEDELCERKSGSN